jgi:glycosyltransferase involved in cell wall biosynthesis
MKILLINDYATIQGGANLFTLTLRDELRRRGHEVRLFTSRARSIDGLADSQCFGTVSRFYVLSQTVNPSAYWQLRRTLAAFRPDVVHVTMFLTQLSPLILPLLEDVPSLYHVSILKAICPMGTKLLPDRSVCQRPAGTICYRSGCLPLRAWLPLMLQMKLWRRWRYAFKAIVANSESVRRQLTSEGIEVTDVVWNGVPVQPPRPPLTAPPTVGFAGSMIPLKGVDVLLRAFATVVRQLPAAQLLVVGSGAERKRLEQLVADLELSSHVSLTGHLTRAEMESRLAVAWVQAVPSFAETFGLVAAEAAMRGTAVVASAVGGLSEIVQDGRTGFLIAPGHPDALAEKLVCLLKDRALAERMGQAGREFGLSRLSLTTSVDRFERLYHTLCRSQATS